MLAASLLLPAFAALLGPMATPLRACTPPTTTHLVAARTSSSAMLLAPTPTRLSAVAFAGLCVLRTWRTKRQRPLLKLRGMDSAHPTYAVLRDLREPDVVTHRIVVAPRDDDSNTGRRALVLRCAPTSYERNDMEIMEDFFSI